MYNLYKKASTLLLVFFFAIPYLCAQGLSENLNEMLDNDPKDLPDSTLKKLIEYSTKNWQQTVRSNLDSSLIYATKAAEYSKAIKNDSLLFHAYRRASNSLIELGKLDEAREYCDKMFSLLKEDDYYAAYRYYTNLGLINNFEGKYQEALKNFLTSLEKAEAGNLVNNIPAAFGEISRVFNEMGQPLEALKYAKKDVAFTMDHGENRGKFIANYNLANKYVELDSFYQALELYELADSIGNILNIPIFISALDLSKGRLYIEMGEADNALPFLNNAKDGMEKAGDLRGLLTAQLHLGRAYNQLSRHNEAVTILRETIEDLESLDFKEVAQSTRQNYAEALYHSGNGLMAYEMLEEYRIIDDSIKSVETSDAINELEIQYQTAEKERKINTQALEIEKGKYQRNMMLGGLAMMLWFGGFLIAYLWYRNKTQNRIALQTATLQDQKILQLEQERSLLAMTSMIEGQEAERKRIAQDLHDGLGGILSNIKSQLHALEHKVDELAGYDLYGKASGMIDSASKEVRRIATNMMPLALAKLGLKAAIEDLVSKVEQNHPISINLHITSLKGRLEQTKEIMTYRIIQELVNNVIKHAGASTLLLQLDDVNGDLLLTVEDNGKGFNYQEALNAQGIGMKSILSRVKYLKGELDVSSSSQGTCVVVHIPGKTCSKVN